MSGSVLVSQTLTAISMWHDSGILQAAQTQDQLALTLPPLSAPTTDELKSMSCPTATSQHPDVLASLEPWLAKLGPFGQPDQAAASDTTQPGAMSKQGLSRSALQRQMSAEAKSDAGGQLPAARSLDAPSAWHPHLRQLAENRAQQPALPHIPIPSKPRPVKGEALKGALLLCVVVMSWWWSWSMLADDVNKVHKTSQAFVQWSTTHIQPGAVPRVVTCL